MIVAPKVLRKLKTAPADVRVTFHKLMEELELGHIRINTPTLLRRAEATATTYT